MDRLRSQIRDVPDFLKKGIVFKDLTPAISDPETFQEIVDALAARYRGQGIRKIVGIESRGCIFGAPLAYLIGAGFTLVRKPGKLPYDRMQEA